MNGYDRNEDIAYSQNKPSDALADAAASMDEERTSRAPEENNADLNETQGSSRQYGDDRRRDSTDRTKERSSRDQESRDDGAYYEEPATYNRRSSDPRDASESSSKSKRRSRVEDDDTVSVASSGSRRNRESTDSAKKDKKSGFISGLLGRKPIEPESAADSLSRQSTKDSRDAQEEPERRRRRRRTDSEYGDEDDSRSATSESRHRHHHRHRTDDNDYDRDRQDADGEDRHHHHHHGRSEDDKYDRDQSFLGIGVEDMPPLPDSDPVSTESATVNEEQDVGMPAPTESDTETMSRERADAFDLIRPELAQPGSDAHDSTLYGPAEHLALHSGENALSGSGDNEQMDFDMSNQHAPEDDSMHPSRDVEMEDSSAYHDFEPTSPSDQYDLDQAQRRVSINRPISHTAVPLRFPFGTQPSVASPRQDRASSVGGSWPATPVTPGSAKRTRQGRPHSTEMRPLYIVERNRQTPEVDEALPSLPSSKPSSRASSQVGSDENYESALEDGGTPSKKTTINNRH